MTFWIAALGLTAAVALLLAAAARRGDGEALAAGEAPDLQVYKDQLAEVDRDVARGVLSEDDAERARTEISRRILALDKRIQAEAQAAGPGLVVALVVLMLAGGAGLYAWIGSPSYGDLGIKKRIALSQEAYRNRMNQEAAEAKAPPAPAIETSEEVLGLVQRLRDVMKARPDDPRGWELLARYEAALGNYGAAYRALDKLFEVRGTEPTADELMTRAELMVIAAGGYVSPEAEETLKAVLAKDPGNGAARFYMGELYRQSDRPDLAFETWAKLLDEGPEDAPWIAPIRDQIDALAQLAGVPYTQPPTTSAAGPSAADVEAAQSMSAEDRNAMIRGMVERLESRLASEGGSPEEWARLINALGVLGDMDRARKARDDARAALAGDTAGLAAIEDAARKAGLTE